MIICAVIARRRNYAARPRAAWRDRINSTRVAIWALMVPLLIVLDIRSGIITETEAAGVICVYALVESTIIPCVHYRVAPA